VRRLSAVLLLCFGIALTGAAPSRPTPKPTATPAPTATPNPARSASPPAQVNHLPIVVVFPFGTSSDIAPGNGEKAAQLFVEQMNAAGGVDTIAAPTSVKQSDYLTYAKNVDADYYVTGYMMPVGAGVSLVEQVVSVASGTMQFGQTAQIQSFADASAAAVAIHDSIVAREESLHQAYTSAQASATATPMPNNQANLGKGISSITGLFRRKGSKNNATPAPVVKPDKGVLVAHVNGSVPASNLTSATSELYAALNQRYNAKMTNASGLNLSKEADAICGTNRNNTIATGTLSAKTTRRGLGSRTEWTFNLDVYTCWGAKLATQSATAGSLKDAVTNAVSAYAKDHPSNG
jgi:hypothetical protein